MTQRIFELETKRLRLRSWKAEDLPVFADMTADPEVMRYFPAPLSREESDAGARRIQGLISQRGWGFWAAELKETGEFIGFVGLHFQEEGVAIPNTPFVEIGWRLAKSHWLKGYASEAAREALRFAFEQNIADAVYAFTTLENIPSQKVMEKIGMSNTGQDFDHPRLLDKPSAVKRHCLYRITRDEWLVNNNSQ